MKQPTVEQLEELMLLRQRKEVVEYMEQVKQDYTQRLIGSDDVVTMHKLQGSIETIQLLLKHIHTDKR